MKIAVLSGKGGTGKTLVCVNLAFVAGEAHYLDCDVEEPNGHLFFTLSALQEKDVELPVPVVDPALCNGCKSCVNFCAFHALAHTGKKLLLFDTLCHACGGCLLVCPEGALSEKKRRIGKISQGRSGGVQMDTGWLNPGESSGVKIIHELFEGLEDKGLVLIDAPAGSTCHVMESIKDADYCLLVTEASAFGAHDLENVRELVEFYQKPFGVVLNKCTQEENPSERYCQEKGLKILCRIPFSPELGALSSSGRIAAEHQEEARALFTELLGEVRHEAASSSQR